MKKNLKTAEEKTAKMSNKGITLIALVVTIIILLILAGITITAVLSEGGIFSTAKRTQDVQNEAAIREKMNIMLADAQVQKLINNTDLKTYLIGKGYTVAEDTTAGTVTITEDGYNVTINKDTYQITGMTKTDGSGDEEPYEPTNPTVAVTGVRLDKTSASVPNGGILNLTATVEPTNATNKNVTWTSEDNTVATVNNGTVEALKVGSTKITVTTEDGSFTAECNITVEATVADLIGKPASSTNTYTQDKYGNKVVVPANFIVLGNGGTTSVVYDWDEKNGQKTNVPVVQDGIVIQHETDKNEFVWVPVGETDNEALVGTTNKTNIQLGRYDTWTMNTNTNPPTPPNPKQVANKDTCDITTANDIINVESPYDNTVYESFFENSTGTYDGTKYGSAKFNTLGTWISNTLNNKGYYIARYEASYGANGEVKSVPSVGTPLNYALENYTVSKTKGQLWNYIEQEDASTACKALYPITTGAQYYSELVNSYAWDTAIIFMQTYGEVDYAERTSLYVVDDNDEIRQPANTGERGAEAQIGANTTDKVCNIYDMASNLVEWTTETHIHIYGPRTVRGGIFWNDKFTAGRRVLDSTGGSYDNGFRPLLDLAVEGKEV